jgi:hypothetical protein
MNINDDNGAEGQWKNYMTTEGSLLLLAMDIRGNEATETTFEVC